MTDPFSSAPGEPPAPDVDFNVSAQRAVLDKRQRDALAVGFLIKEYMDEGKVSIPELPEIYLKVTKLCSDPSTTIEDLVQVIASSTALATQVLKLANSSMFQAANRTLDLPAAIMRIGFKSTSNLALAVASKHVFRTDAQVYADHLRRLGRHAVASAAAAAAISSTTGRDEPESAFLGGLMHDVGKAILLKVLADVYEKTQRAELRDPMIVEAVFDLLHRGMAMRLLDKWSFPRPFIAATVSHRSGRAPGGWSDHCDTVHTASFLARQAGFGRQPVQEGDTEEPLPAAAGRLGLTLDHLPDLLEEVGMRMRELSDLFGKEDCAPRRAEPTQKVEPHVPPPSAEPEEGLAGTLSIFTPVQVIQALSQTQKSGEIVFDLEEDRGRVWLKDGVLTAAAMGDAVGPDALSAMANAQKGRFSFRPGAVEKDREFPGDTVQVLLDLTEELDIITDLPGAAFADEAPDP